MESSEDKNWASRYLLDPLTAPEPSEETGPGTNHLFAAAAAPPPSPPATMKIPRKPTPSASVRSSTASHAEKGGPTVSVRSSNNPYRNSTGQNTGYPSPPPSTSPRTTRFPELTPQTTGASTQIPTSTGGQRSSVNGQSTISGETHGAMGSVTNTTGRHRRTSSLNKRYPGDQTDRPLDMLKHEAMRAQRSPHFRKKHHVGADSIDTLDNVGPANSYHHEGPYDATLLARNITHKNSPIAAVRGANEEALRATPKEMVQDAVTKHRPLDGTAMVPPGMVDRYGRVMRYQEGTDMMIECQPEGGAYKRWPGVRYLPDDRKGKGEPSFSLERALNQHHQQPHRRNLSESQAHNNNNNDNNNGGLGAGAVEMLSPTEQQHHRHHRRPMSADSGSTAGSIRPLSDGQRYADWERQGGVVGRSASGAGTGAVGGVLRKRFGSLRIGQRRE